jgi:hypothetical protein
MMAFFSARPSLLLAALISLHSPCVSECDVKVSGLISGGQLFQCFPIVHHFGIKFSEMLVPERIRIHI